MKKTTTTNPFEMLTAQTNDVATATRRLSHTAELNSCAAERATETIKKASANPELHELANKMMAGDPADLLDLFEKVDVLANVEADAEMLADATEDELKRLLESRRSDRSKCKKKGINSNMLNCRNYVAAMYAELVVRQAMGKPYTGTRGGAELDLDSLAGDQDAIVRKVKSLQSKKCRIKKLAEAGVAGASDELTEVEAEIERLNALRPTARVATKAAVKSIKVDELREALSKIEGAVPEEILELMKKLG